MATANLVNPKTEVISGNDNVVIVDNFQSVRGGRTLDVTGYTPTVLHAGHVIIRETATDEYKPMPITGDGSIVTLGTLTEGSGYTEGTYTKKSLSGGSGSGAVATIVVDEDGKVASVTITTDGKGYVVGDELTTANTNLGGAGSGFKVVVASIDETKDEYASLPEGHTYAGILIASIPTAKPFAGIMVRGTVNYEAAPYPMDSILAAVKAALPLIDFRKD